MRIAGRLVSVLSVACCGVALHAGQKPPPDLTRGDFTGVDRNQTWNLGPTGMRGWICSLPWNNEAMRQNRFTADSRQILVTDVGTDTPADGIVQVDDVIIGVDGGLFTVDARKSLARAVTEAEKNENGGILKLKVFRIPEISDKQRQMLLKKAGENEIEGLLNDTAPDGDLDGAPTSELAGDLENRKKVAALAWTLGEVKDVELRLPVMGTYSTTAPYDCPKSQRILDNACAVLAREEFTGAFAPVTALALLATGNKEYWPRVREYARSIDPGDIENAIGMISWDWGYKSVFLCEYYLLTGDTGVLSAIRKYTINLARRQGKYGTFGHGGSQRTPDGQLHGPIPPYGAVNAAGLVANLAIILGEKCGIEDQEITDAKERAASFFSYYAGKGCVPYGEHPPFVLHGANGKTGLAAVMFRLLGNRPAIARDYAMMSTAGYANRQYGHTGQGLSYLWAALGANCGGPDALGAYINECAWQFDLARRSDGAFTYDGAEQCGPGTKKGIDNTYFGKHSYSGLSPTACYVLTYSAPRKVLFITGKGVDESNWLSRREVDNAIRSGRMDLARKAMSVDQLVSELGNWSPIARMWISEELASRPEAKALEQDLIAMATGPDANARQGACMTLGHLRSEKALPTLVGLLRHDDYWLRYLAADAIKQMGDKARPHLVEMLETIIDHAEPLDPVNWRDPVQLAQGKLAETVFSHSLLGGSVEDVNRDLLYRAIRTVATNPSGKVRSTLAHMYRNKLTPEDVSALAPDIVGSVKHMAPADTMFGSGIREAGVALLVKYRYREAIPVLVEFARTMPGHGSQERIPVAMKQLCSYGTAARSAIPDLRALIVQFNDDLREGRFPKWANDMRVKAVEDAIQHLQTVTEEPDMKTIDGFELK